MYKTFIQLVLLLILVLIIFFISNTYFSTEDKINDENKILSLDIKEKELKDKNVVIKNIDIDNEIINLTYEKFDINGNKYLIQAKKGLLDSNTNRTSIIYMDEVEASLTYLNNDKLNIYSKEAIFDRESFKTTFSNNVKLIYQEQTLESDYLDFLIDKNIAIFRDNVKYYNQNTEAFGDIISINLSTKEIDIKSKNQKKIRIKQKN